MAELRWVERIQGWAQGSACLLVAPAGIDRAIRLLDVPREKIVALPNGADIELFRPQKVDRQSFWRRVLFDEPQGWLPGGSPGSARYDSADVARLASGVVIVYVGRFTAVKAIDRLIAAFAAARRRIALAAGLVLVGGHPGEWEGEHPAETAARLGVSNVFLAGWYSQRELPQFYAASDVLAIASRREQFGQVIVEAMACGLPTIAMRSLGPAAIVEDGRTGWLVPLDDVPALAAAIVEAVNDPDERLRRGDWARVAAVERFSWSSIAAQLALVLAEVVGDHGQR
ncbi:MAG: glycosyltransferase family 4 protein [Solirubrobacterales bacterium]|nr:glycosyltransferase family 4 protein [Solirubrobacterales bacterium]